MGCRSEWGERRHMLASRVGPNGNPAAGELLQDAVGASGSCKTASSLLRASGGVACAANFGLQPPDFRWLFGILTTTDATTSFIIRFSTILLLHFLGLEQLSLVTASTSVPQHCNASLGRKRYGER